MAVVVSVGLAVLVVRGCGSGEGQRDSTMQQADAQAEADSEVDHAGFDGLPESASIPDAGCTPQPIPPDVPAGWVEYPVMNCMYRLYVPPSRDMLPEGLTWEPCTKDLGPDSFECRNIRVTWPTLTTAPFETPYGIGGVSPGYVEEDGRVVLQLCKLHRRVTTNGNVEFACMGLVVEADGPVRQAFWMQHVTDTNEAASMVLSVRSVSPGKSTWTASEWDKGDPVRDVSIGGDDTDLRPPILMDRMADSPDSALAYAGRSYYLEQSYVRKVFGWDGTDHGVLPGPTSALSPAQWVGDTLLWAYESGYTQRLWTWTKQDGARELTPFGSDNSTGAGNPASDGKDLVWVQGENLGPTDDWWPKRSIMTAPFTTDPSELKPRRLRSWAPHWIGTAMNPPVVGCGHAAFIYVNESVTQTALLIVSLSDGVSWVVHGPPDPGPHWGTPLAITCNEVFAIFTGMGGYQTVRRIRLDSLGPGTPPD